MTKEEIDKLLEHVRRPMYKIEKDIGMPMNTLQRAVKGTANFPKKWTLDLKDYVKTGSWISANLKESKKTSLTDLNQQSEGTTKNAKPPKTENITIDTTKKEPPAALSFQQQLLNKKLGI